MSLRPRDVEHCSETGAGVSSEFRSNPAAAIDLPAGELHIWRAPEDLFPHQLESIQSSLSSDERERAGLFRRDEDRQRFTMCRGILRDLLSRYCDITAGAIRLQLNAFGKPSLVADTVTRSADIEFNLSHTPGMALFAFASAITVGVDVEAVRFTQDFASIGRRFLHAAEWQAIAAAPPEIAARRFFECWTCKEACLKADGRGLAADPELLRIDPPSPPSGSEATGISEAPGDVGATYWIRALPTGDLFAAAVATRHRPDRLQTWEWTPSNS